MSVSRRTALAAAFSIVPRHVLGGAPYVAFGGGVFYDRQPPFPLDKR